MEQASLFDTVHSAQSGRTLYRPNNPGFSEDQAAKQRAHNANVERHRAEAARVLASPVRRHVLEYVALQDGQPFRLSSLYAYVDEHHACGPDSPRRLLGFLRDDGLMEVENVDRGVYRARLTDAGRAAAEGEGGGGA